MSSPLSLFSLSLSLCLFFLTSFSYSSFLCRLGLRVEMVCFVFFRFSSDRSSVLSCLCSFPSWVLANRAAADRRDPRPLAVSPRSSLSPWKFYRAARTRWSPTAWVAKWGLRLGLLVRPVLRGGGRCGLRANKKF